MAELNLTTQTTKATTIQIQVNVLKTAMDQRKPFWDRMPIDKKKAWIASGRDPIMNLAWDMFKYLNDNFFHGEET